LLYLFRFVLNLFYKTDAINMAKNFSSIEASFIHWFCEINRRQIPSWDNGYFRATGAELFHACDIIFGNRLKAFNLNSTYYRQMPNSCDTKNI